MRMVKRVSLVNGSIRVETILPLCVSFGHRVIDGAEAARLTKGLIRFLEMPEP